MVLPRLSELPCWVEDFVSPLQESDLIPVTTKMHIASNLGIKILGATILCLSATGPDGQTLETRQMTYITDASDKLFLSQEACITLGIIQETFPTIGMQSLSLPKTNAAIHIQPTTCGCPKHTAPPPPSTVPCPGMEENLPWLKSWEPDNIPRTKSPCSFLYTWT